MGSKNILSEIPNNLHGPHPLSRHLCPICKLTKKLCICDFLPRIANRTPITLAIHWRELRRKAGTSHLLRECFTNVKTTVQGVLRVPMSFDHIDESKPTYLLFPSEDATCATELVGKDIQLIAVDGNWNQAKHMTKRHPYLKDLPKMVVPMRATTYRHLREKQSHHMTSFEAITKAISILEPELKTQKAFDAYDLFATRWLSLRTSIPKTEVEKRTLEILSRDKKAKG